MNKTHVSGYLFALTAIFFWSVNLIIANSFATSLHPLEITFGRWTIASVILIILAWKDLKTNFRLILKSWKLVLALAITGMVIDNTLIYYAGRTASAIDMGLLDVTGPLFLVLLSWIFLRTPISGKQWLGLAIALLGVMVIIVNGDFSQLKNFKFVPGDILMLLNTFSFAVYSLLQHRRPVQISQTAMLACSAVVGALINFPLMKLTTPDTQLHMFDMEDVIVVAYLGIFNSVISYLSWNSALATIGNVKTSIIYYLLPLFSGFEAYLFLGEKLYMADLAGGALVIGGIALVSLSSQTARGVPQK